jgi:hypothetical protein
MRMLPLFLFAAACAEPPSSVNPGVAHPGAAQPGNAQPNDGAAQAATLAEGGAELDGINPGAVVPDRGPDNAIPAPEPALTQDAIVDGVTLSGELICDDCSGSILVQIEDASTHPPLLLTKKSFAAAGPFSMAVPKKKQLIVMVIHDENGDGIPTPGEALGLWTGGLVDSSLDVSDISLTVGLMPETPPVVEEETEEAATPTADQ